MLLFSPLWSAVAGVIAGVAVGVFILLIAAYLWICDKADEKWNGWRKSRCKKMWELTLEERREAVRTGKNPGLSEEDFQILLEAGTERKLLELNERLTTVMTEIAKKEKKVEVEDPLKDVRAAFKAYGITDPVVQEKLIKEATKDE